MTDTSPYRRKRRLVQLSTLILIALVPATGLLRIDLTTASFFILGHQIWWSSFTLVFGLALILATAPILTYMTVGTVWCGWACPQNLLAEWANNLTHRLLGKRASVEVGSEGLKVAAAKNKLLNWAILGTSFLLASLFLALIPFLFFYTPTAVWEMVTYRNPEKLSPLIVYLIMVFLVFIDIAVLRYFVCDYVCFYRMGQRIFKTHDALHVTYDATRSPDCTKCNYCATVCITNIQPTHIKPDDICINCGECIDACDRLHKKSAVPGLLTFELSSTSANTTRQQNRIGLLLKKNRLLIALLSAGIAMTVWGIVTQPKELPKIPPAVQQKARDVARICNAQCVQQQSACKQHSIEGCYRAAACRCACTLQNDPTNAARDEWKQCAERNSTLAAVEHNRAFPVPQPRPDRYSPQN
ncbi:MAG: 4Fe-4S binding protein [Gallionella sp.]|jgi:polyferredoxin|nr:4Fe-4S binding protein [Gallionella sp.]